MKLFVHRLGRILDAEIELKPLTVFFGENGTQKTWTAHAYFKLLEAYRLVGGVPTPKIPGPIADRVREIAMEWAAAAMSREGGHEFEISRSLILDAVAEGPLSTSLTGSDFASALGVPQPREASARLEVGRAEFAAGVANTLRVRVDGGVVQGAISFIDDRLPELTNSYFKEPNELQGRLEDFLTRLAMGWRRQVRALPAERIALIQLFPLINPRDGRGSFRMPRALVDFVKLAEMGAFQQPEPLPEEIEVALEKAMGGVLVAESGAFFFQPSGGATARVPIASAASLVKSIAGLSLALAEVARGDVLIIDEPEMNAHPSAQVALVELFAMLVHRGVHLVLVTHSPYVLDHLGALVEASRISDAARAEIASDFALGRSDVFLGLGDLAVYHFRGETVVSVYDQTTGALTHRPFAAVNQREGLLLNDIIDREAS